MKRVLVISYYWPPAGGISVLRSLKIVKHLRGFGWEPIIYIPSNATYDYLDPSNESDVPEDIKIMKGEILEPFRVFRKLSGRAKNEPLENLQRVRNTSFSVIDRIGIWIRANFFIPDARMFWINPSVKRLSKYLVENPVDAIFTDGPPHTNTMIGYHLSKKYGIPWLADFQDPWTQVDYLQDFPLTKSAWKKHISMEQAVFKQASKITIASPTWKNELESIGAKNVDVIYYGYDEDDFKDLNIQKDPKAFTIFHGGLLGHDRFPKTFFDLLSKKITDANFQMKLKIKLAGKVDYRIIEYLKAIQLFDKTEILGFIPRKEVLKNELEADLLLLPLNKSSNAKGRLPGKLYECLRAGNTILGFGPRDGDAAYILNSTDSGQVFEYEDEKGLTLFIENILKKDFQKHARSKNIEFYSNKNQTKIVANYLTEIAG